MAVQGGWGRAGGGRMPGWRKLHRAELFPPAGCHLPFASVRAACLQLLNRAQSAAPPRPPSNPPPHHPHPQTRTPPPPPPLTPCSLEQPGRRVRAEEGVQRRAGGLPRGPHLRAQQQGGAGARRVLPHAPGAHGVTRAARAAPSAAHPAPRAPVLSPRTPRFSPPRSFSVSLSCSLSTPTLERDMQHVACNPQTDRMTMQAGCRGKVRQHLCCTCAVQHGLRNRSMPANRRHWRIKEAQRQGRGG